MQPLCIVVRTVTILIRIKGARPQLCFLFQSSKRKNCKALSVPSCFVSWPLLVAMSRRCCAVCFLFFLVAGTDMGKQETRAPVFMQPLKRRPFSWHYLWQFILVCQLLPQSNVPKEIYREKFPTNFLRKKFQKNPIPTSNSSYATSNGSCGLVHKPCSMVNNANYY